MSSNHSDKNQLTPAKKDDQPSSSTTTSKNEQNDPSLLTRIQNSASSLIQDSLTRPSGGTLSSDLAHVLDSGSKGSSYGASGGSTLSAESWRSAGPGSSSGPQDGRYATAMNGDGFRSTQFNTSAGGELDIDNFQNSGFFQEDDAFVSSNKGKGKGKIKEQSIYNDHNYSHEQDMILDINEYDHDYESAHFNAYEIAWINASRLGTVYTSTASKRLSQSSISEANPSTLQTHNMMEDENDGAEVVNLLSNPSFQPGLSTLDDNNDNEMDTFTTSTHESEFDFYDLNDDPLDTEGFPLGMGLSGLSPAQMQIIDFFRRQQQQEEKEQQQKRITSYSLVPGIDSFIAQYNGSSTIDNGSLRNEVVANLIGAEEWMIVDDRYNDDVWGYLKPALEAAAAEIKEKEENPVRGEDGPAVKRLRMILRHMARL